MKIKKPIFIIGSGRSGTTILYRLLCLHPDLCWFSNYSNRFPYLPVLSSIQRLQDLPYFGGKIKSYSNWQIDSGSQGNIIGNPDPLLDSNYKPIISSPAID